MIIPQDRIIHLLTLARKATPGPRTLTDECADIVQFPDGQSLVRPEGYDLYWSSDADRDLVIGLDRETILELLRVYVKFNPGQKIP